MSRMNSTLLLLTMLLTATLAFASAQTTESTCPQLELLRGRDGRDGRDGTPGAAGSQGAKGERGDSGGLPGPRGLTGVTGATGEQGPKGSAGPPGPTSGGVTYVRWGRSSCSNVTGSELVYAGRAGGTFWSHTGGGSNYLCMPDTPQYILRYTPGSQRYSEIYGTEYEASVVGRSQHNVPCAVCFASTRVAVLMIPARTSCPTGWTREYYGYIMAPAIGVGHYRSSFECIDKDPESIPGSGANTDGAVFYHVEANCNGLPCPPYNNYKELNCAVCTK